MKRSLFFLTTRALIALLGLSVLIAKGRPYVTAALGVAVDARLYFLIGLVVFGVVLALCMRGILEELRRRAGEKLSVRRLGQELKAPVGMSGAGTLHKYPPRLIVLELGLLSAMALGAAFNDKPITFTGTVIMSCVFALALLLVMHTLRYSVAVTKDDVCITGLVKRSVFRRSEIESAKVVTSKGGRMLVITLLSGRKMIIWSFVTNFNNLRSALAASHVRAGEL